MLYYCIIAKRIGDAEMKVEILSYTPNGGDKLIAAAS
jgi:hypothetical protein